MVVTDTVQGQAAQERQGKEMLVARVHIVAPVIPAEVAEVLVVPERHIAVVLDQALVEQVLTIASQEHRQTMRQEVALVHGKDHMPLLVVILQELVTMTPQMVVEVAVEQQVRVVMVV